MLNNHAPSPRYRSRTRTRRSGFTLLEVMIATAVTLLMMLSLAQIFKIIGDSMQRGRAILELNNRLRTVTHRIRTDLGHLTINPEPPNDPAAGAGYFEYYDGPMTDYTTASYATTSASNRIGDCDDIVMGTVKAGDTWFTGKVPRFILEQRVAENAAEFSAQNLVTIASQYAELVIFAQPQVAISKSAVPTGSVLTNTTVNAFRDPGYMTLEPAFFQDDNADAIPDSYRLHYRLLLIRPDLNLPFDITHADGNVPAGRLPGNTADVLFKAQINNAAIIDGISVTLPPYVCDMAPLFAVCDLSMRRVFDPTSPTDFVAANSLADLGAPENRFAHVQIPVANASTTMPVLALGPRLVSAAADINEYFETQSGSSVGSGFLHPAYVLGGLRSAAISGDRLGEDLLATDLLAFDVKGFDEGVPLLLHRGANGTDDAGAAGSDDLVLSPNDPGYAQLLRSDRAYVPSTVGTGEFVDLAWGYKTYQRVRISGGSLATNANVTTQLSALSAVGGGVTNSTINSGTILSRISDAAIFVFQPRFDTWSTHYEGDGILQAEVTTLRGVVRINGEDALYGTTGSDDLGNLRETWRQNAIDAGTDGIDNPGSLLGVDDSSEFETSAPYNVPLRGVQITVRMEDPRSRQVRQMTVTREFVNK